MDLESQTKIIYFLIVIWCFHTSDARQIRWKRQAIPSTHVQVHSLNSNVSVTSAVRVVSAESRIDLKETFLNASIWSNSSELLFDNFDTYVNYTALNVEDIFHIQSAIIHKQANKTQFSMVTNRTQDGQTSFNEKLEGSVSLRVNDSNMGVQALDGALALINGKTRKENVEKKINVLSAVDKNDNMRKLLIIAESNVYEVKIILNSAEVQIEYGPSVIQIDRSYKHMMIFTNKRNISLDTTNSPFEVSMTENQLLVNCKDDRTVATLSPNSTDVGISVGQYSKLEVDRGKGVMSVGSDSTIAERVNVTSMHLQLNLEGNVIRANSNRSHIDMMGNLTKVGLTAAVHNLTVAGGIPRMILDTGNITVKVLAVEERAVLPSIVPPFVMPKDNYDSLGPVQNESSNTGSNNEESDTGTKQAEEPQALTTVIPANAEFITKATEQSVQGVTEVEETTTEQDTTSLSTQPSPLNDPFDSITTPKQTTATEIGENESPSVMWTDLTPKTDSNGEEHNTHLTTQPGIPMVGPGEETTVVSETPRNEGKKQSDVSTRNEPRSIPDVFAQTTTDGFVIGQFAQFSQNGYQNEEQSQSSPGLFEFSATINAIDLYTSETPMFTVAPGQAPFPKPEGIVERKRRFTRSINDALVMRLFVPDSVNISDPEFRSSIQNDLVNAVRESVSGSEKKKRSADEQELDVDLRDMGREGEALSVHFIVFEEPSGLNTNHSAIAEAMNSLGVARLSQDMHYPVVEVLHVSLDSSLVWVSLSSALSVFLIFIIVLVGWKFALYDKIKRRFIRQNQVNENELFQKTALS